MILTILLSAMGSAAFGQLYFIAGTTNHDAINFGAALYRVTEARHADLVTYLADADAGVDWIAVEHEFRKAVIVVKDWKKPSMVVKVADLDKTAIVKQCVLPQSNDNFPIRQWVSNVPGIGQFFEWDIYTDADPLEHRGLLLDPSMPCAESFPAGLSSNIRHIVSNGRSGVAETGSDEGTSAFVGEDGRVHYPPDTKFSFEAIPVALRQDLDVISIMINNAQTLVLTLEGAKRNNFRALIYRKSDRTWHELKVPGGGIRNMRGFGKYISIVESPIKKAVAAQMASGTININEDVRTKEKSAGHAQWRKERSFLGPNMEQAFEVALETYPGRLHLYDIENKRIYTKVTNQGDSEVLLVEKDTMYYRVSNRLYSASITAKGIGAPRLLATAEEVRDAHWAFIVH